MVKRYQKFLNKQTSEIKALTNGLIDGIKLNMNTVGVEHSFSDMALVKIGGAVGLSSLANRWASVGSLIGTTLGGAIRANQLENNFDGSSINLRQEYSKFTFDGSGNKTILKTLAEHLGAHE
ncbi:hypothetical protein [Zunongwangia pacifica]|uniref:Uncharacterized protein n=1 Tax=Zunongwangia pacifica TaxID=2911062 RepID=A0A9X1ZVK5_9FLAO|nr:hypothetical protein [Zunongwangia pacifica]MCL6220941.1 hypothetical protein [Zunongwangia pacifica]